MSASRSTEGHSAAHLNGEWARLLFATLRDAGVRDLWVSPGSRSTPFIWAALHTDSITLRSVIDERSAAFLALGHARVTGRPSALLCTSGSAAANYFPAVVEASLSHLPLIVLTADRPLEVQHAAAPQTIDQLKLYGDYARRFFDLGLPDATPSALIGLRRAVAQAVAESLGPLPGPVHLNLRARKPLEPALASNDAERALSAQITELIARPIARHASFAALANEAVRAAARTLSGAASGAIVVGPLPAFGKNLAEPLGELSHLTGFPLFAEASSQVRFALADHELSFPLFDWLLSAPDIAGQLCPEVLLCIGHTPTSSAFERWAARVPRRLVLAEHAFPDAIGSAELSASGNLAAGLSALIVELQKIARGNSGTGGIGGTRTYPTDPTAAGLSVLAAELQKSPPRAPHSNTRTYPTGPAAANSVSPINTSTSAGPAAPAADSLLDTYTYSYSRVQDGRAFASALREAHERCRALVTQALGAKTLVTQALGAKTDSLSEGSAVRTENMSEGSAAKSVVESLPEGAVLVLGNSLPIRDVDAYVTHAARLRVVSQRGANGIDGLVSGAIGSAVGSGAPTLLLVGDVSLLHDLGGLASASLVTTPLVIAVIDNAGGRIFDQLPVQQLYARKPEAEQLWLTPPGCELSHAAALFGLRYAAPASPPEIRASAAAALAEPGVTLLHLRVVPDSAASMRQQVLAALASETRD